LQLPLGCVAIAFWAIAIAMLQSCRFCCNWMPHICKYIQVVATGPIATQLQHIVTQLQLIVATSNAPS
jgi:hypothetical protein